LDDRALRGIFGLLGGWLIDRFGRKTIMAASISSTPFSALSPRRSDQPADVFLFHCTTSSACVWNSSRIHVARRIVSR